MPLLHQSDETPELGKVGLLTSSGIGQAEVGLQGPLGGVNMKVLANMLDSGYVQFLLLRITGLPTELPGHLSLPILGHGSIVEGHERGH